MPGMPDILTLGGSGSGSSPAIDTIIVSDSKLRRETSNFKIDANITIGGDSSPVFLKQLSKDLKPEEFIGMVINMAYSPYIVTCVVRTLADYADQTSPLVYMLLPAPPDVLSAAHSSLLESVVYYNPVNGVLSIFEPIVDEVEADSNLGNLIGNEGLEGLITGQA